MLTEEQAKTKWCPHVRVLVVNENEDAAAAVNIDNNDSLLTCCASDCMMWRWVGKNVSARGYCGLAGKP